ncbi:MAG: methyltransferase domain-containing protein [Phormidesmis sp.]
MENSTSQPRDLRNFAEVDQTTDVTALLSVLDRAHDMAWYQDVNQQSFNRLHARLGQHLLDVGCGAGTDAQALASLVSPTGRIIGLDCSSAMVEEARRRAQGLTLPVEFQVGDVCQLDFADETFDGCRSARVLCFQPNPAQAVAEMVRVVKPGGYVVSFEPECSTLVIDAPDLALTHRLSGFWRDGFAAGCMARHLPVLLAESGLVDIEITPHTLILRDASLFFHSLFLFADTVQKAGEAGVATPETLHQWQTELEEKGKRGQFLAALTFYLVSGQRA